MSAVLGVCAASISAGALLVGTGVRQRRPDPVARGLGQRAPTAGRLDGWLDRWSAWLGWERQASCLVVLGESRHSYRRRQGVAAVGAVLLVVLVGLSQDAGPVAAVWALVALPSGLLAAEKHLHWRAQRRRADIGDQVLQAAEHVALAVTAGLTVAEAVGRAAVTVPEPLASWLARVRAEVRTGRALAAAFGDVAATVDVEELSRLADTVITAAERGVPLAEVLLAQVDDARARARSARLERAGRAEIGMLLPIVFLLLPCVVVVALFPGAQALGSM